MSGKYLHSALPGQLHGEITTTLVTVSGGPTLLPTTPVAGRKDFLMYNGSVDTVYVGGATVTISTGIPVLTGGSFGMQAGRSGVYATVSGVDRNVRVLEAV